MTEVPPAREYIITASELIFLRTAMFTDREECAKMLQGILSRPHTGDQTDVDELPYLPQFKCPEEQEAYLVKLLDKFSPGVITHLTNEDTCYIYDAFTKELKKAIPSITDNEIISATTIAIRYFWVPDIQSLRAGDPKC